MDEYERQFELPLSHILERVMPLREKLLSGITYLWRNDKKKMALLDNISTTRSRVDKGNDLIILATIFNNHWADAEGHCEVTQADVKEATMLSGRCLR